MTGYELSKDWFDWAFENPDINTPNHTALYLWAVEKWNRMSQKEKFGFPASEAMEALGIKSYNTYKKTFKDLVKLGAIKLVQESKNQYTANIIALSKFNKAHTKALSRHLIKQVESTSESSSSIDKPITLNLEPETKEQYVGKPDEMKDVKVVIDEINKYAGTAYKPETKESQKFIKARLKQYDLEDCLKVINVMWAKWGQDEKMRQYFTPTTLFRESNFEKYYQFTKSPQMASNGTPSGKDHRNNPDPLLGALRYKDRSEFPTDADYINNCNAYGHTINETSLLGV